MLISNMAIDFLNWQSRNTQICLSIKKFVYEKTKIVYFKFLAKYPNRAFLSQIWWFFCRARNIAFVKISDVYLKYDNSFFKPLPKYPNKTFLISNSIFLIVLNFTFEEVRRCWFQHDNTQINFKVFDFTRHIVLRQIWGRLFQTWQ